MASSPPTAVKVLVSFTPRMEAGQDRSFEVAPGTPVRRVLGDLGVSPEGAAVWWEGEPVPLDFPIATSGRMEVVRTFSGG